MHSASQFVIPIYQRKYSWEDKHCKQIWNDIVSAGADEKSGGHFIGSIVYITDNAIHNSPLLVIDGQQRLTTLTLLIVALSKAISEDAKHFEGFSPEELKNSYLINPYGTGEKSRKLILSEIDKDTLFAIIDGLDLPSNHSHRIVENFKFFENRIIESKNRMEDICRGLSKLLIVHIALERGKDNPQLVFESMNSKGLDLSQADLIRNYMLMGLDSDLQKHLYDTYWQPMEQDFGQESYNRHFDRFMRHYLTVKMFGKIPRLGDVYDVFKNFAHGYKGGTEELLQEIRRFSKRYCAIALEQETNVNLRKAFHDIVDLQRDVAYPLLLELYSDYDNDILNQADFLKAIKLIESYIFRRAVCGIPPASLNKTFATFGKALDKKRYLESMIEHFLSLTSYKRFPDDKDFKKDIKERDLYGTRNLNYCFGRLENFGKKELTSVNNCTIEHIMPQSITDEWKADLGENWEYIHKEYLHKLGNLTLTGYNPEYRNRSFREKRDMERGFKQSTLYMNEGLGKLDEWNEEEIKKRADKLADKAVQVWVYPERENASILTKEDISLV